MDALKAIVARIDGDFDNPALVAYGPLMTTEGDVRRIACEALEAAPDPLDIAYLAMGADCAWRAYVDAHKAHERPECFDGIGQDGAIADVIDCAKNLARAWPGDEWAGGVWYYDVSEELGAWIIREWIARGHMPDSADVDAEIVRLIAEAEGRFNSPVAT